MPRPTCIGIDLGTTNSVVAHLDADGNPDTISNSLGELLTPSALLFDEEGVVSGTEAVKASVIYPDRYADCFKRDIGSGSFHRRIRNNSVPPEVLSGFLIQQLKQDAESRIGPVKDAIITVPAFFDETRRKATQNAGRLAGLEVLDIINEPTAAALAFGHRIGLLKSDGEAVAEKILVYDLGGGTFDVTILELCGRKFRAIATDGDVHLGGEDFDARLAEHLAGKFVATHGIDPRSDPQDAAQLWLDTQQAKHTLSQRAKASVVCFYAGIRMRIDVTREEFQQLTSDLLQRTETTTKLALEDAGLTWNDIGRVLLIGGATRMPIVAEMIERLSGKTPDRSVSPDEAVAHGAAIYAGMLLDEREGRPAKATLVNVNSHSLGVVGIDSATKMRTNCIVVPKNTPLPCRVLRTCVTHVPSQRSVKVMIVEGESHRPDECISLGECVVRDLPEGLPKGAKIRVEFSYAANGRIEVTAHIPAARQSARVEIEPSNAPNLEDLATWSERLIGVEPVAIAPPPVDTGPPIDFLDQTSILRRLDYLYAKIGEAAMQVALPEPLQPSQRAAIQATAEAVESRLRLDHAAEAALAVAHGKDAVRVGSEHANAKVDYEQKQSLADFTCLVLGRDCSQAETIPPTVTEAAREAKELQIAFRS
jgi:molecular chaperone DnaK